MTMPKKIWAENYENAYWFTKINKDGCLLTPYTRSDIAEARIAELEAEVERLRGALEWVSCHMNDEKPLPHHICDYVTTALGETK